MAENGGNGEVHIGRLQAALRRCLSVERHEIDHGTRQLLNIMCKEIDTFISTDLPAIITTEFRRLDRVPANIRKKEEAYILEQASNFLNACFADGNLRPSVPRQGGRRPLFPALLAGSSFFWANKGQYLVKSERASVPCPSQIDNKIALDVEPSDQHAVIHKNLDGFLSRQLDSFIKHEFLDLASLRFNDPLMEVHLLRMVTFREVVTHAISFLARIEGIKRWLWEKPKRVTKEDYVITLDKIPTALFDEVVRNEQQLNEWREILGVTGEIDQTFMIAHPTMPVDTRHFSDDFKGKLVASFDDLDSIIDGLAIKSDNYQALRFLADKYAGSIQVLYIDPPYNTGSDDFAYNDRYQESSWLSMLDQTLQAFKGLAADGADFFVSIDDNEVTNLSLLLDDIFGVEARIARYIVVSNPRGRSYLDIARSHEYLIRGKVARGGGGDATPGARASSVWDARRFNNQNGTSLLRHMFPMAPGFHFPKPIELLDECFKVSGKKEGTVLDFFAGTGTLGHAVMEFNQREGARLKYVMVEAGGCFDTILIPRMKKVMHSPGWKDGRPTAPGKGSSHVLKYIELEQYDDVLNDSPLGSQDTREEVPAIAGRGGGDTTTLASMKALLRTVLVPRGDEQDVFRPITRQRAGEIDVLIDRVAEQIDKLDAAVRPEIIGMVEEFFRDYVRGCKLLMYPGCHPDHDSVTSYDGEEIMLIEGTENIDTINDDDTKSFFDYEIADYMVARLLGAVRDGDTNGQRLVEEGNVLARFKEVCTPIINMVSQLANLKRALWCKERLSLNHEYCITVGKILDKLDDEAMDVLLSNEGQVNEWIRLLGGNLAKEDVDEAFLRAHPTLMVDTCFYKANKGFKNLLLADLDDAYDEADGTVIIGEPGPALDFLAKTFKGRIDQVYTEPRLADVLERTRGQAVYGGTTRLAMECLGKALELVKPSGNVFWRCDDHSFARVNFMFKQFFDKKNLVGPIIVNREQPGAVAFDAGIDHDYIICAEMNSSGSMRNDAAIQNGRSVINRVPRETRLPLVDKAGRFQPRELRNRNPKFNRANRPNLHYPVYIDPDLQDEGGFHPVSLARSGAFSVEAFPKDSKGVDGCWRWGKQKFEENRGLDPPDVVGKRKKGGDGWLVIEKYRGKDAKVKSVWSTPNGRAGGGNEVVERCLMIGSPGDGIVLDPFSSAAGVARAVIDVNHREGTKRRYVLVDCLDDDAESTKVQVKRLLLEQPTVPPSPGHVLVTITLERIDDVISNTFDVGLDRDPPVA